MTAAGALAEIALPPSIARVMRGSMCSGCGLCAGIDPAIQLARNELGYWRPVAVAAAQPDTDAKLAVACPGSTVAPWGKAPNRSPLWGPYFRSLTAWSTDQEVRHAGSSGGMLSSLALFALETGRVDRVLHVGMDASSPLLTSIRRSRGRASILGAAGSRYAPAAPLAEIMTDLQSPGRILFIGKPCDVGALRQLTRTDPSLAERFPLMLSFFCGATPSQDGTDRIVRKMGAEPADVLSFRYRGDGWPGFATALLTDGSSRRLDYAETWGDILSKEVQLRCKTCPDAVGGVADVAAGDAWYPDETGYPSFKETNGRSLVLTRTAAGDSLVAAAEAAGKVETHPLAIAEIIRMQGSQGRRKRLVQTRLLTLKAAGRPTPVISGVDAEVASKQAGMMEHARTAAGLFRRLLLKRI